MNKGIELGVFLSLAIILSLELLRYFRTFKSRNKDMDQLVEKVNNLEERIKELEK